MALLTPQEIRIDTSLNPTFTAASAGGDSFMNTVGRAILFVRNQDTSSMTFTLNNITNCNQNQDDDITITVAPNTTEVIGLIPRSRFNDSDNIVTWTYSSVTSVSAAVCFISGNSG